MMVSEAQLLTRQQLVTMCIPWYRVWYHSRRANTSQEVGCFVCVLISYRSFTPKDLAIASSPSHILSLEDGRK